MRGAVRMFVLKRAKQGFMRKQIAFFLIIVGICASTAGAQSSGKLKNERDAAEIMNVLASFAAAWNSHDMIKFAELFTPDAEWVNIRGARWIGVDAIRKNHVDIHKRFYSKSRLEFMETSVRSITRDVAVIHAKEVITGSDVPKEAGISPESQMSLIVTRSGSRWLITNGQNTNIAPSAAR